MRGEGDGAEGGAAGEGVAADGGKAGGEGDGGEGGAAPKAWLPMEVRLAGRVTETRLEGGAAAEGVVADGGEALRHGCVALRSIGSRTAQTLMARTTAFASSSRGQSKKAPSPIERPSGSGSVTEAREGQRAKA